MDLAEVGNGKLRPDVALRTQSRAQRRVIERLRFSVRQPGVRSRMRPSARAGRVQVLPQPRA
jgi:hypothetical protein